MLGSLPATRPRRFGGRAGKSGAEVQGRGPRPAKPKPPRAKPSPAPRREHRGDRPDGPQAVRHGAAQADPGQRRVPSLERINPAPPPPRPIGPPSGTELVTTAIQASGELARIGLAVGGQVLRRAVDRLPRP